MRLRSRCLEVVEVDFDSPDNAVKQLQQKLRRDTHTQVRERYFAVRIDVGVGRGIGYLAIRRCDLAGGGHYRVLCCHSGDCGLAASARCRCSR